MSSTATDVVIHPLVLLSVADHYNRVASNTQRRVVGVLLGSRTRNTVDITNSFAVPFEEDLKDPSVWFLGEHTFCHAISWNSACLYPWVKGGLQQFTPITPLNTATIHAQFSRQLLLISILISIIRRSQFPRDHVLDVQESQL